MAAVHGLVAQITLVLVLVIGGWALFLGATHRAVPTMLVAGLLWVAIMVLATALVGGALALSGHPPHDPLHFVYGALAVAVLPGAWLIARSRAEARQTVRVLAVGSVVLLILVMRLFQTGS